MQNREQQLLSDYPEILSKLLLLHGAGLTIQNSFTTIVQGAGTEKRTTHYVYLEMERTLNRLKSGASELGTYTEFGNRCQLHPYKKLASLLEQNMKKGSKDLQDALRYEVADAFATHKTETLKSGEKASTKMLFPMIMIFLVIMIIILAPAFLSFSF